MSRSALSLALLAFVTACSPGVVEPACDPLLDADADGLDDCTELELGTSKDASDSDGDGFSDYDEVQCVSDPVDSSEVCYACGWEHNDPGDLSSIGKQEGDTLRNLEMIDQCGETVAIHDLAGAYHIAFITTQWCTSCLAEASELRQRTIDFEAEAGMAFSYVIMLFQDIAGDPPDDEVAAEYADVVDARQRIPVLSDTEQAIIDYTPYDGSSLPGKCVLSDRLEMLDCYTGHSDDDAEAFDLIREHAGL